MMASPLYLLFAGVQTTAGFFVFSLSCACLITLHRSIFALPIFLGFMSVISGILDLHFYRLDAYCIEIGRRVFDFFILVGNMTLVILLSIFISRQKAADTLTNDARLCVYYFIFVAVLQSFWSLLHCRRLPSRFFKSTTEPAMSRESTQLSLRDLDTEN